MAEFYVSIKPIPGSEYNRAEKIFGPFKESTHYRLTFIDLGWSTQGVFIDLIPHPLHPLKFLELRHMDRRVPFYTAFYTIIGPNKVAANISPVIFTSLDYAFGTCSTTVSNYRNNWNVIKLLTAEQIGDSEPIPIIKCVYPAEDYKVFEMDAAQDDLSQDDILKEEKAKNDSEIAMLEKKMNAQLQAVKRLKQVQEADAKIDLLKEEKRKNDLEIADLQKQMKEQLHAVTQLKKP